MSSWAGTPRLAGVKVLVVERVPDVREIVTAALEQYGASVTAVDSTVTALGLVKRERPDVLVSSLSMPEKDGYWLIRQVRSLSPDRGGNTPAVAFTGCTTAEDRLNALRTQQPANRDLRADAVGVRTLVADHDHLLAISIEISHGRAAGFPR